MSIDRMVFAFAGTAILLTLLLAVVHSEGWLWVTALIGANMLQAAFTGFCPLARFLKNYGYKPGEAFH
jgi:hypothetical protein